MIAYPSHDRFFTGAVALSAALTLSFFLKSATAAVLEPPPPPDDRRTNEGTDEPPDPRFDHDKLRGGPRGENVRDRFRRWRENRRDGDFGPDDELPPEMIDRMMDMMRDNLPGGYARLDKLRDRNPERFRGAIRRIVPVFKEYMFLKDERPDLATRIVEEFKNEERLGALSRDYRDAAKDPTKQTQIAQEIESIVRKQMEFHQQRMTFRLEQFEKRIKEQQAMLDRRRKSFEEEKSKLEEHIAKRVDEIKKGDLRGPFPRRGPGHEGPDGFGEGPPRGPHGPGEGSPRGRRSPDDGPPRRQQGPHAGPPDGPAPDEPPPPSDDDPEDE